METLQLTLIIVRHAQTHKNKIKVLQGCGSAEGSSLTALGYEQASKLCEHLQSRFSLTKIFASPALRTQETVRPLRKSGYRIEMSDAIREIDVGDWESKPIAELEKNHSEAWRRWQTTPLNFTFPNGESLGDVFTRACRFLADLPKSGDVLLVSHSATISTMVAHLLNEPLSKAWENGTGYHRNAEYSEFEINNGKLDAYTLKHSDHL